MKLTWRTLLSLLLGIALASLVNGIMFRAGFLLPFPWVRGILWFGLAMLAYAWIDRKIMNPRVRPS